MTTRVSTGQYLTGFTNQIFEARRRLEDTRNEISSGLRVAKPSDDPGRSGTINNLQSLLQRIDRHQKRLVIARNSLETQEGIVSSANETMIRAQELATQAANGVVSVEVRAQMAEEVFQLRNQMVALANSKFQDVYIYGGLSESDTPFDANDTFYATPAAAGVNDEARRHFALDDATVEPGQDTTRQVVISDTETMRINSTARDVFLDSINALERLGRAMAGYRTDLIDADTDGVVDDPDPLGTHLAYTFPADYDEQTDAIGDALNAIQSARINDLETELSSIGARTNRISQLDDIFNTLKLNTEESRSTIQDADIFEASTRFASLQTSLEALLASGSQISRLSLLDFI